MYGKPSISTMACIETYGANEKAVRALHVQFVPKRLLIDKKGNIEMVEW